MMRQCLMSIIVEHPNIVTTIIIARMIYRCLYCAYGATPQVVIDDKLPYKNGRILFMHSKQPNEFW